MLSRSDLWSLEQYSQERSEFKDKVMQHKQSRQVRLGDHVTLLFEDALTIRYQIQEMLRIEKVFDPAGIQDELDAYNPLIPDGDNWKCTLLIHYEDVEERKKRLQELVGIENQIWIRVNDNAPRYPIADEDLDRSDTGKTSAVHFLRYQLDVNDIEKVKGGEPIYVGIDHSEYHVQGVALSDSVRESLQSDLA